MKSLIHFIASLLLVLFVTTSAFAGEPRESLYAQISRCVVHLESVVLVNNSKNPVGTAFFVARNGKGFIVSARHVVEQPYDLQARVLCKNDKTGEQQVFLLKLPKDKWVYHESSGEKDTHYVDVAAMKIFHIGSQAGEWFPIAFEYDTKESPNYAKNQLPFEDAEPPQPIIVFGFPADIGFDLAKQYPMGRFGILSMKTGAKYLKFEDGKFAEERCCVIDARIFGGNSGSPVMNQMTPFDPEPKLLGLVIANNASLDFAIMEPVSRIIETIELAKDKPFQGDWVPVAP